MPNKYIQFLALLLAISFSTENFAQIEVNPTWLDTTILETFEYRCIGPTRGGRVTAVAGVTSEPSTYYMGATGGGVWKTKDYGITWKNISDGYFESPSIGAITVDQNNPKTIYVGTGSDGLRSNIIAGKGVYKTTDGGKKWENIGLKQTGQIGAVEIHPTNPNIVFVAAIGQAFNANAERGLYRSKDGGKTWSKSLYINDEIGIVDVEFAPDNPNILYAAAWKTQRRPWTIISGGMKEGGIYKSIDGGDNWTKLENGLPQGLIGKADLTVSAADPSRVYALIEAPEEESNLGRGGVYRSNDYGASFELVSYKKELLDRPFYYCNIKADPQNANVLYASATRFFKSTDAGRTWKRMRTPHSDNHDIWINPTDSMNFIQANDGGVNVTLNGGISWSSQTNQATAELYQIAVDDQVPYWVHNPKELKYRFQRVSPIHVSPHNPDVVYHTSQYVHKTVNDGKTWETISPDLTDFDPKRQVISGAPITRDVTGEEFYSTIYAIQESPLKAGLIWTGANDGPVYVTQDGGKDGWKNVTPKDLPKGGRIDCVEPSTHQEGKAYFTSLRYQLGDWTPYIYKTQNYGQTWELITKGIPSDYPVRVVREDPDRVGLLYAGTEYGLFISFDDGKNWQAFQNNLPVTPITDLKVHQKDLVISTMGRSFWILDDLSILHESMDKIAAAKAQLFQPRDEYRLRIAPLIWIF